MHTYDYVERQNKAYMRVQQRLGRPEVAVEVPTFIEVVKNGGWDALIPMGTDIGLLTLYYFGGKELYDQFASDDSKPKPKRVNGGLGVNGNGNTVFTDGLSEKPLNINGDGNVVDTRGFEPPPEPAFELDEDFLLEEEF